MADINDSNAAAEQANETEVAQPTAARTWTLGRGTQYERTYVQKPLGFIRKFRFFGHLGATIRAAVATSGEGAVSDLLGGATSIRERAQQLSSTDVRDAEQFLNLASSLLVYVPDFLETAYCDWLGVPIEDRDDVKMIMSWPADEGGLSDEDGVAIINTFMDQNWEHLRDFFGVHLRGVLENVQTKTRSEDGETTEKPTATEEVSAG